MLIPWKVVYKFAYSASGDMFGVSDLYMAHM